MALIFSLSASSISFQLNLYRNAIIELYTAENSIRIFGFSEKKIELQQMIKIIIAMVDSASAFVAEYFLDYREMLDPTIRWTDRVQSSSGDWTGNLFDFFFRVYAKLVRDLKTPFKLEGITRIDDTPVHKAVREALANCIVNTDFYIARGVVIKKDIDRIVMENPGYIRIGKNQMLKGGISDPRNKALMKMFNMIGIGERAGSGVPDIFAVWESQGWKEPIIDEQYNPDRTVLILPFIEKQAEKTSGKKTSANQLTKTLENKQKIVSYLSVEGARKTKDIARYIGLSDTRTRVLLAELAGEGRIDTEGNGRNRVYFTWKMIRESE